MKKNIKLYMIPVMATFGLAGFSALPTYASTVDISGESIVINAENDSIHYVIGGDSPISHPAEEIIGYGLSATDYDQLVAALSSYEGEVVINGLIEDIRGLLTKLGTPVENGVINTANQQLLSSLDDISGLNLEISGDTELVADDIEYLNYLAGQAGIETGAFPKLNIHVDGAVNFSDTFTTDAVQTNTTFSATGVVTLPEGVDINTFFGDVALAEGTKIQSGETLYVVADGKFVAVVEKTPADDASTTDTSDKSEIATPNTGVERFNIIQTIVGGVAALGVSIVGVFGFKKLNLKK